MVDKRKALKGAISAVVKAERSLEKAHKKLEDAGMERGRTGADIFKIIQFIKDLEKRIIFASRQSKKTVASKKRNPLIRPRRRPALG